MDFGPARLHAKSHAMHSIFCTEPLLSLFRWAERADFDYVVLKFQILNHFEKVHFHAKKCLYFLHAVIC